MAINTESEIYEYKIKMSNRHCGKTAQAIYTEAYNAGKSDAILEFVEMVKRDIGAFVGEDDEFVNDIKVRLYKILDDRKDEVIKK